MRLKQNQFFKKLPRRSWYREKQRTLAKILSAKADDKLKKLHDLKVVAILKHA